MIPRDKSNRILCVKFKLEKLFQVQEELENAKPTVQVIKLNSGYPRHNSPNDTCEASAILFFYQSHYLCIKLGKIIKSVTVVVKFTFRCYTNSSTVHRTDWLCNIKISTKGHIRNIYINKKGHCAYIASICKKSWLPWKIILWKMDSFFNWEQEIFIATVSFGN